MRSWQKLCRNVYRAWFFRRRLTPRKKRKPNRELLNQTHFAQPALGAAGYGAFLLLDDLGVQTDFFAGHSYGEYVALCAAQVMSFADLMRISERRGRVVEETQGSGQVRMVAVQADARELAAMLADPKAWPWLATMRPASRLWVVPVRA